MAHITVTPADDDEVIVAGLPAYDSEAAKSSPPEQGGPTTADDAVEPAQAKAFRPSEPVVSQNASPEASAADYAPRPAGASPERKAARADDGYRETTLEDLESESMPIAQKIVIVAAVVCIIGALVYYFLVMR